jgi:hypothetical protein
MGKKRWEPAAGGMLGNLFGGIALTYWPHFTHRQVMTPVLS